MSVNQAISVSAPGKVILFGEHSVVYGYPAIAASIDALTTLTFQPGVQGLESVVALRVRFLNITDEPVYITNCDIAYLDSVRTIPCSPNFKDLFISKSRLILDKFDSSNHLVSSVAVFLLALYLVRSQYSSSCTLDLPIDVSVNSTLPIGAGLGSSAAYCSVVATFCFYLYGCIADLELTEELLFLIQSVAHEAEKIMHSSPSGVDTTISARGGLITFRRDLIASRVITQSLSLPFSCGEYPKLLIIDTNVPRSAGDAVNSVRHLRENQPVLCNQVFEDINLICGNAERVLSKPLTRESLVALNNLFVQNHEALCRLGVSNEKLDEVVRRLESIGLGAKLTGAGKGGCAIALLCSSMDPVGVAQDVRNLLHDLNVTVLAVDFCVPGLKIQIEKI
ncbi:unnamed protein product [Mesocestoides corti]|uniref:Mevalonate kinase n=1 Tax=Mesocestoides corti TaxID=53468 RepID=A0A0R3U3N3_MESCO|nr:unnamed protein product [Mesocestoides corti]